jgi:AraC-like DNA-binding protein
MLPALEAALTLRGIDPNQVFRAAGVQPAASGGPMDRLSVADYERIWVAAVRATGEETLGLDVARQLRPTAWHALGLALESSRSLRDFGERLAHNYRFVSQAAVIEFKERGEEALIKGHVRIDHLPVESEDTFCGFVVRFIADLSVGACRPRALRLIRPEPRDGGFRHREFFGCPVAFGTGVIEIAFDRASENRPFPGGSAELAQHNDRIVLAYLTKLDRSDIASRVRSLVIEGLSSGPVKRESVARRLHMSPRTLQNKLGLRDTSFQDLVEETRRTLARAYVEDRSLSMNEITYLLGFSNASNFSRAFKRWTGQSPRSARREARDRGSSVLGRSVARA